MTRYLFIFLFGLSLTWGQSSLDILSTPTDTRDAALGINLSPSVKPTRILTHPNQSVTLNVWNWVADIQGATMGIGLDNTFLGVQAMHSGEIEVRDKIPTEQPLSTFEYTLFDMSAAHAHQWQDVTIGLGAQLIYERTLNASATGLAFNFAAAYQLSDKYLVSGGIRHFGVTGKLDEESTDLPTELWAGVDAQFENFSVLMELNNGPIPTSAGVSYALFKRFELMAGIQVESTDPSATVHPSAGFTASWTNFTLGYAIYQMDHTLGPRQFITLYWDY